MRIPFTILWIMFASGFGPGRCEDEPVSLDASLKGLKLDVHSEGTDSSDSVTLVKVSRDIYTCEAKTLSPSLIGAICKLEIELDASSRITGSTFRGAHDVCELCRDAFLDAFVGPGTGV